MASALINLTKGAHSIRIVPGQQKKDNNLDLGVSLTDQFGINLGVSMDNMDTGTPSEPLNIDYIPNPLCDLQMKKPSAAMNADDAVLLTFSDFYNADEYLVTIRKGNDVNYIPFNKADPVCQEFIQDNNSEITLRLDSDYLQQCGCMQLQLDQKYVFSVQLRKYAQSFVNGETLSSVVHESKASEELSFTPIASWTIAPVITSAEQTNQGEVTLAWTHEVSATAGCEYDIYRISKAVGIKTGEELVTTTADKQIVLPDLQDGDYCFCITPRVGEQKGAASQEANVKVNNSWDEAPALTLEQTGEQQVTLTWAAAPGVDSYHIEVLAGNSQSLLKFVDMDYQKYTQIDVAADGAALTSVFDYEDAVGGDGVKLKFEIMGIHIAVDGSEQHTKTGSATITLEPLS